MKNFKFVFVQQFITIFFFAVSCKYWCFIQFFFMFLTKHYKTYKKKLKFKNTFFLSAILVENNFNFIQLNNYKLFVFFICFLLYILFIIKLYQQFNNKQNIFFFKDKQLIIKNTGEIINYMDGPNLPDPNNKENLFVKLLNNLKETSKNFVEFSKENYNAILICIGTFLIIILVGSFGYKYYIYSTTNVKGISQALEYYLQTENYKMVTFYLKNDSVLNKKILLNYPNNVELMSKFNFEEYLENYKTFRFARNTKRMFSTTSIQGFQGFSDFRLFYDLVAKNNLNLAIIEMEHQRFCKYFKLNDLQKQKIVMSREMRENFLNIVSFKKFANFNELKFFYQQKYSQPSDLFHLWEIIYKNEILTFTNYILINKDITQSEFLNLKNFYFYDEITYYKKNDDLELRGLNLRKRMTEKQNSLYNIIADNFLKFKQQEGITQQQFDVINTSFDEYKKKVTALDKKMTNNIFFYIESCQSLIINIEEEMLDIINHCNKRKHQNEINQQVYVDISDLLKKLDFKTIAQLRKNNPSLNYYYSNKNNNDLLVKDIFLRKALLQYDQMLVQKITLLECNLFKLHNLNFFIEYELNVFEKTLDNFFKTYNKSILNIKK